MPLESLLAEGWKVRLYYANANIHPSEEYEKRLETLRAYAQSLSLPLIEDEYDTDKWEASAGVYGGPYPLIEGDPQYKTNLQLRMKRCSACYELRFKALARQARKENLAHISTTLTVSPYQFTHEIIAALEKNAKAEGVRAVPHDWQELYPEATRRSRAAGMYRQNYCGCHFSLQEAELERLARKAKRKTPPQESSGS